MCATIFLREMSIFLLNDQIVYFEVYTSITTHVTLGAQCGSLIIQVRYSNPSDVQVNRMYQ